MKSTRLLSALILLQAHGRLSSRELAERLEISERTAHRDMEALSEAGVPVFALRGAQGGWELAKGWRTRVPGLDEVELRGLLMAQPSALGDPELAARRSVPLASCWLHCPAACATRRHRSARGSTSIPWAGGLRQKTFQCSRLCRTQLPAT